MSLIAWVLLAIHAPVAYVLLADGFRTVNRWADNLEEWCLPRWLQWRHSGDKVTWIQHTAVAFGGSLYGGLLSLVAPESFAFGAALVGWIAVVGYAVREELNALAQMGKPNKWTHPEPNRVGWAVDGIMDVVGPIANAVAWTVLA